MIFTATIQQARQLAPHVRELTLSADAGSPPLAYLPGQWLSLRLPVGERPPLIRAYSLATAPRPDGTLTLCFDRVEGGAGSGYLWDLPVGATVEYVGPMGNFALPDTANDLVMIAQFTGIVPFRAMLDALDTDPAFGQSGRSIHLLHHAETPDDLVYHPWLADLAARSPWLDYHPVTGGDTALALLETSASEWMPFVPMVCGIRPFTLPVRDWLREALGFDRRAVKVENYSST